MDFIFDLMKKIVDNSATVIAFATLIFTIYKLWISGKVQQEILSAGLSDQNTKVALLERIQGKDSVGKGIKKALAVHKKQNGTKGKNNG